MLLCKPHTYVHQDHVTKGLTRNRWKRLVLIEMFQVNSYAREMHAAPHVNQSYLEEEDVCLFNKI